MIHSLFLSKYLQLAYFTIALVNDVFANHVIRKYRDILLAGLVIPFAFKTTLTYHSISMIDQELVFPEALKAFFPSWLNFFLHTLVSILPLFEMGLSRNEFKYRKTSLKLLLIGLAGYLIWVHVVFLKTGFWVYDLFALFNDVQRQIFFLAMGAVAVGLYFLGELLNLLIVGKSTKRSQQKKMK
jgi:hypothetical protein